ncbi:MAG: cytochrome c biogenesis protein [Thermoplasmata archaeon]|nr:MAG: cytochrome c biogenesis protein [Thermoplasmata archaeon]
MKKWMIIGAVAFLVLLIGLFFLPSFIEGERFEIKPAYDFTATDADGNTFNLSDYKGDVVILHITGLENPLCMECLEEMEGQLVELEKLTESNQNLTIVTINKRSNPYSEDGRFMAERDFGVNVSWHWVEDFSPFPITSLYYNYFTVEGAFSNPTIVLIDGDQKLVGVYHVYCLGKGKIDDIQTAESLSNDASDILEGDWEEFKGKSYNNELTFVGIFGLGILTALSPCSIALLVAMISYVGSIQKQDGKSSKKKYSIQGLWIGVVFTLGMAFVFFIFGLILSSIGIFIEASTMFYLISGIILVILGVNVFKPLTELLSRKSQSDNSSSIMMKGQNIFTKISKKSIYLGAFFLGILFSIGWAPCAMSLMMPIFILTLSQKISIISGGLLLFVFGLGHGVPIIPLCAVTSNIRGKLGNKYVTAGRWMQKIFGLIIIVIGIVMAMRFWEINFW